MTVIDREGNDWQRFKHVIDLRLILCVWYLGWFAQDDPPAWLGVRSVS